MTPRDSWHAAPGDWSGKATDGDQSERVRLFAEAVLGKSIPPAPDSAAGLARQRELDEFVRAVRGEPRRSFSDQELDEFVRAIREGNYDPAKHPRGAFPQNTGWYSPTGGSGGGGTVVTITYKPGSPATAAVPSANGKPGKPAKPAVPPSTEIAFGGSASNSGTSAGAGAGASNSAADLGLASIGSVYTAINDYHVGCTVRIGLNQLQNKLNTPSAAKTSGTGWPT